MHDNIAYDYERRQAMDKPLELYDVTIYRRRRFGGGLGQRIGADCGHSHGRASARQIRLDTNSGSPMREGLPFAVVGKFNTKDSYCGIPGAKRLAIF
jgi:hypothetical protein